ncbi:unnamed protein product [Lactuca saligna]|uniref:Chromo domain-containing protein n=1 Tax=Lactuca saligna TaxID=75948 RepID=A0AA35YY78_LACSI|nr:unnamed protein product [Lactuca saligna]
MTEDLKLDWTLESVLGVRMQPGEKGQNTQVLIKWKEVPEFESTWEDFVTISEIFPEFKLEDKFISHKSPTSGFDFISGKRIEQKLIDYNQEAERFGGYAYEEVAEVSPGHRFIAYTMYDKDNNSFNLCVRDLNLGSLCKANIREEDVLKEKDAFEDLKSLTEIVNQLIDTINQVKEDEKAK